MARMFCTLEEAARKLEMTEAELEAMLAEGTLREFRDGSRRLVKVADLAAAGLHPAIRVHGNPAGLACPTAVRPKRIAAGPGRLSAASQRPRPVSSRPQADARGPEPSEIKLPLSAAVVTRNRYGFPPARQVRRDRPTTRCEYADSRDVERTMHDRTMASQSRAYRTPAKAGPGCEPGYPACRPNGTGYPAAPAFRARQARPQTRDMSLKEWIWAGLINDQPDTLIVLLAATIATIGSLTAAVYLLVSRF